MDEKTKKVINFIHYTLEHYPHPEDLEWSTEEIQVLLSYIEQLKEEKKGMVRLSEKDMKKLGWSYT